MNNNTKLISIDEATPFVNEQYSGLIIAWSSPEIGFGEYTFYLEDGKWYADSECMGGDFGRLLLDKFMDLVVVK